ncbi:MAG: GntR family transcriptional regulator, partial [Pseudorhodoplanes sp.]
MTNWIPEIATDRPRYIAIADAIAADLASGKLNAGDRLPPQRDLAFTLGVTIGTVTRAYQEAAKRGLLSGEVGRGSYLRQPSARHEAVASTLPRAEPGVLDMQVSSPPRVHHLGDLEAAFREILRDPNWSDYLDYSPG